MKIRHTVCLVISLGLLVSCTITLVSPYDPVIDQGVMEFKSDLNALVQNMAELGGKPEGTYEANKSSYNELHADIDVLIQRANMNSVGGCKMAKKLTQQLMEKLGDQLPAEFKEERQNDEGNSYGCIELMLINVKEQLKNIQNIHENTDKCSLNDSTQISCIRMTTVNSMMRIANQSIDAVWVVESTKKKSDK